MASSPLRAPVGQPQSRLLDMKKKFQQRHLATVAAVKDANSTSSNTKTMSSTVVNNVVDGVQPVPPARRFGVSPQQSQRRSGGPGPGDKDSVLQVDVKGKQQIQMRPTTGRISSSSISNSKTAATMTKKPLAAVNGNGATGPVGGVVRGVKKLSVSNNDEAYRSPGTAAASVNGNRLLLPPVVQPTVINALASGESATDAVASVRAAAAAAGMQRPVVRASRLPPATRQQMPAAQVRQRVPSQQPSKAVPPSRPPAPAAAARVPPTASNVTRQPKKQLSENRGPPAKGMARCPLCARDFAADRLPKHEEVCRRTRERDRKRKVFDTSRKRLEAVAAEAGVDVMSFKKKSQKEDQRVAEKLQKKKDAWRRKHDALVRNVRAARAVQRHLAAGGSVRDLPPELDKVGPEQEDEADSDLVKCPHCARTFNEASAERHIPLCADRQRNAAARLRNKKR